MQSNRTTINELIDIDLYKRYSKFYGVNVSKLKFMMNELNSGLLGHNKFSRVSKVMHDLFSIELTRRQVRHIYNTITKYNKLCDSLSKGGYKIGTVSKLLRS